MIRGNLLYITFLEIKVKEEEDDIAEESIKEEINPKELVETYVNGEGQNYSVYKENKPFYCASCDYR